MDTTRMILTGTLRLNIQDGKGEDYWKPEYNLLEMPLETFIPHYVIKFRVPQFTYKVKYYAKLIDIAVIDELNELFQRYYGVADNIILYHLMQIRRKTDSRIIEIYKLIKECGYSLTYLMSPDVNYKEDVEAKECTYIYNYLLQALIRVYLEFQYHFENQIEDSKKRSYDDFFILKLGIPAPTENCLVELESIPVEPRQQKPLKNHISSKCGFSFGPDYRQCQGTLITNLFLNLERGKFIKSGTPMQNFRECFAGKEPKQKVIWIAGKSMLSYFIKRLYKSFQICDCGSKWLAAANCFADEDGNKFDADNLKDQKKPKLGCDKIDNILSQTADAIK